MRFRMWLTGVVAAATLQALRASPAAAQAAASVAGDDLIGLWGADGFFGPQVRGALVLEVRSLRWTVRAGGVEASAMQHGDSVELALPGGAGVLRVWIRSAVPEAYWVQPTVAGNPAYATPVRLRAAGGGAWFGQVIPLDARFRLYLAVSRASDGTLRGVFRNPDVNWPGRMAYRVERAGDAVAFINPVTGRTQYRQPYDSAARSITFDFGAPLVMHPRTLAQAVGFVPRTSPAPYRYRKPVELADGWRAVSATSVGMDTAVLERVVQTLLDADPVSDSAPRVHALVVVRHGRLVLDEYFRGSSADEMHDLRSASKTMTSVLAGVAMQQGARLRESTRLPGTPITLAHLLSHTSGKACNDDDESSPGNEDRMQSQSAQQDWYAFFAALPVLHAPGATYSYCSAGMNAAGSLVGAATGQWLPRTFDGGLALPMQFGPYAINLMPTGEAYAGGGMRMRARDFLKFGALYLNGGVWQGRRLVPAAWVTRSTAHHVDRDDGSDDGLGWHRHMLSAGGREFQTYEASGNGGQFLVVVPALSMAVVVTAGNYGQYGVWRQIRERLIPAVIAAAR